ncbi:LamG-like jellyroll fold domain-containing protein [Pseudactinotalea terrae]|uniref:LamG-like jellyroll fold domain-containing protein n=1 Tax=Pseudactinotalea terrae TaxID=1743262 RepID=UPI0012E10FA3|nr:LamG-like jellyroll fold domain-containing protein [Pseudactinotalea terrae]
MTRHHPSPPTPDLPRALRPPSGRRFARTLTAALGAALVLGATTVPTAEADSHLPAPSSSTWALDGDAQDSTGERHGEALPGVTFADGSARFSAADDSEIQIPFDRALEPGNRTWQLTLTDVVPGPLTRQHQALVTSRSTNNQGWAVYIMPDGEIRFWSRIVGRGQWAQYASGVIAQAGTSYDIAITREANQVRIQIAGGAAADVTYDMGIPIVNNGSNPMRIGNGGDEGQDFFYRGSIGAVSLTTTPSTEPWAGCDDASDLAAGVTPPDPAILQGDVPQDEITQLSLQAARNANRFVTTTWWDDKFGAETDERIDLTGRVANTEYALRGVAMASVNAAILLATGTYDAADTGVSESEARERVVRLATSAAAEHIANTPQGWGPESSQWQASLWAYYNGFAAWLLWDDLTPQQQSCVANMVAMEADAMPAPGYYRDPQGRIISPGDTKAEENTWQSSLSGLAAMMMPNAAGAQQWRADALELSIAGWAAPQDVTSTEVLNGRQLDEFLQGSNVDTDGTVANHNLMHPIYMLAFDQSVNNALAQQLAGHLPASAFLHNVDLTYGALVEQQFDSPPWDAPGGTIYVPGEPDIYYPDGNDWGTTFPMYFAQADVIADSFDIGSDLSTPPSEWARLHLQEAIELQSRFEDGHTYLNTTESNYGLREERTAQIAAHSFLTRFLNAQPPACVTNRPYTTETDDPLLGELEHARQALDDAASGLSPEDAAAVRDALARVETERDAGGDGTAAVRDLQLLLAGGEDDSPALVPVRAAVADAVSCTLAMPIDLSAPAEAEAGDQIDLGLTGGLPGSDYTLTLETAGSSMQTFAAASAVSLGALTTGADGAGIASIALPPSLSPGPVTVTATTGSSSVAATIVIQAAEVPPTEAPTDPPTDPTDGPTDGPTDPTTAPTDPPTSAAGGDDLGGASDDSDQSGRPGDLADTGTSGMLPLLGLLAALTVACGVTVLLVRHRAGRA